MLTSRIQPVGVWVFNEPLCETQWWPQLTFSFPNLSVVQLVFLDDENRLPLSSDTHRDVAFAVRFDHDPPLAAISGPSQNLVCCLIRGVAQHDQSFRARIVLVLNQITRKSSTNYCVRTIGATTVNPMPSRCFLLSLNRLN
jgi:hypothetical protein